MTDRNDALVDGLDDYLDRFMSTLAPFEPTSARSPAVHGDPGMQAPSAPCLSQAVWPWSSPWPWHIIRATAAPQSSTRARS